MNRNDKLVSDYRTTEVKLTRCQSSFLLQRINSEWQSRNRYRQTHKDPEGNADFLFDFDKKKIEGIR